MVGFQLCKDLAEGNKPEECIIERKYDGTMALYIKGEFYNRRGTNITHRFPELKSSLKAVLVGEIVIFNPDGSDNFNAILRRSTDNLWKLKLQ